MLLLLGLYLPSASCLSPSTAPVPFPTVPTSYDSHVSLFFPLSSFSLSYREYYSSNSSVLRRDHHFTKADGSEYINYRPHHEAVTVLNSTTGRCKVYTLSPEQSTHLYYLPSFDILQLLASAELGWQYQGLTLAVRNASAHHWRLDNVTITASGVLCTYNASYPSGEQCTKPSDSQPSYSQLIDQTSGLSTDVSYSYVDVAIDYYVHTEPVSGLDGSVPLRVVLSGRRASRSGGTRFTHYFDWLQFKPLDSSNLYIDTTLCSLGGAYAPAIPRPILPGYNRPAHHPSGLPRMPTSFTMLVEEQTSLYDERNNQQNHSTSGAMVWTRLSDMLESTQYLVPSTSSSQPATLSSTTLYYNYSSSPPLVWTVNSTACGVQRVTPCNSNPLASPIPVTFLALFKSNWWPDMRPMSLSYSFAGWQEVHGVPCMHYLALTQTKLADPINFWLYNSSIFLAPPNWQHPDQASYQLPIQMINTGSDFYYPDRRNRTDDNDKDKPKDKDRDDKSDEKEKQLQVEEEAEDAVKQLVTHIDGTSNSNCSTIALSTDPTAIHFPIKEPCHSRTPAELPTQRSFSEVWDIYGLSAPVSLQAFDLDKLGCPIALQPPFPPRPLGYSSGVVVSSSLTTQVYAYTEYVDFRFGQRVDGRFNGRDSIEVTHPTGLSVLFDNPLQDEAAYGYGSREDYSTHTTLPSLIPSLESRLQATCKSHGKFHFAQMAQQFVAPIYHYYLTQYPPSAWVHGDASTLDGMLVDQWQAINQSTTVDGDLIFDTAIFYFSHPESLYDGQVPLRFEISKVMIATSSDESQTVLESTVVDFLQWSALECSFSCYLALFSLPPVHDCPIDTYETRYETLFNALAAPALPAEYVTLPIIPASFTAVILTQLNESSSQLYALRWYVDEESERDRLDWAPLNSHASSYAADHHSIVYQHEDDWGAYQLNSTGCTSLNMSSLDALNPLLLHHSGSLPAFFAGSFDDATVLQPDKVDGVDVVCFQKHYSSVYNRYTNRTYAFVRQACFAQRNWVAYPSGQQQLLTSVVDSGTYTYWSSDMQALQSADFVADYDVLFVEADVPAAALFNLTSYQCQASGITYVDPVDDDDDDDASALAVLTSAEALGLAVLAGAVVTVLAYSVKRLWQRRYLRSVDEWSVLHEPLRSLSTSESCGGLSSSALNASLGDVATFDAELVDARDGVMKPSLIL